MSLAMRRAHGVGLMVGVITLGLSLAARISWAGPWAVDGCASTKAACLGSEACVAITSIATFVGNVAAIPALGICSSIFSQFKSNCNNDCRKQNPPPLTPHPTPPSTASLTHTASLALAASAQNATNGLNYNSLSTGSALLAGAAPSQAAMAQSVTPSSQLASAGSGAGGWQTQSLAGGSGLGGLEMRSFQAPLSPAGSLASGGSGGSGAGDDGSSQSGLSSGGNLTPGSNSGSLSGSQSTGLQAATSALAAAGGGGESSLAGSTSGFQFFKSFFARKSLVSGRQASPGGRGLAPLGAAFGLAAGAVVGEPGLKPFGQAFLLPGGGSQPYDYWAQIPRNDSLFAHIHNRLQQFARGDWSR